MSDEKISVITPMYNAFDYLPKYFESMFEQTYKNLEIIIVDDGSTDGSGELCDEYANKDSRITVYHNEHRGVVMARAFGAGKATGDYVGFVDADDWAEPEQFDYLYNLLKKYNADIAQCGYFEDRVDQTKLCYTPKEEILAHRPFSKKEWKLYFGSLCNKLVRRDIMPPFTTDERFIMGEDAVNCTLLYKNAKTVIFGSRAKYHYRVNEGSICTANSPDKATLISHFLAVETIKELLKDEPAAVRHYEYEYIKTAIWVYGRIARNNMTDTKEIEKKARKLICGNFLKILFSGEFTPRQIILTLLILPGKKAYHSIYSLNKLIRG